MLRLMRHQYEQRSCRRLFQILQQCVGCGGVHRFRWMDQDYFIAVLVARYIDEIGKIANLIDTDLFARFFF